MRRAVLDATLAALVDGEESPTLAGIARRADVQPSTVYRRWGSLAQLVGEAVSDDLERSSPLPDTGSVAGDVHAYAAGIAADLAGPRGPGLLRAAVLVGSDPAASGTGRPLSGRRSQVEAMLQRARDRGEAVAGFGAFFEVVLGPLYGYALFGPAALGVRAPVLAQRFLDLPADAGDGSP